MEPFWDGFVCGIVVFVGVQFCFGVLAGLVAFELSHRPPQKREAP